MAGFTMVNMIEAPPEKVFGVFADIERAAERIRGIERVEMLTEGPVRVGTRFRETRIMFKKEATEEMEFTVFEPGKRYDVEADSCGAHYRSVFRFAPKGDGTEVSVEFAAKPASFFAKLMSPLSALMMGPMKKCVQNDIDDLKKVLESGKEEG